MNLSEQDKEDITDMIIDSRDVEETADEMFERLGYKLEHRYKNIILIYCKNNTCIQFDIEHKTFCKFEESDSCTICDINMQELKAINKKCKELGWL